MFIYKNNDAVPWKKCVATVGFFDGVHGGHRFLFDKVKEEARRLNAISVAITFSEHPRKVMRSDFQPQLLTTTEEKLALLAAADLDACFILDFTPELSQRTANDFMTEVLHRQLHVQTLFVGHDHRFGHHRQEGFTAYKQYGDQLGMNVIAVNRRAALPTGEHFSSTQIRKAILSGDITLANRLLTYPYTFSGKVIGGYKIGRQIGFPTANLSFRHKEKIVPAAGVYAVWAEVKGTQYAGMMNIGYRPTFSASNELNMEVHLIDFEGDIYDQTIRVACIQRIRDEMKFSGVNELTAQLTRDKQTAIQITQRGKTA